MKGVSAGSLLRDATMALRKVAKQDSSALVREMLGWTSWGVVPVRKDTVSG